MAKLPPRVRIESSGVNDLHIYDEDGREVLKHSVRSATWQIEPGKVPVVLLEVLAPELVVNGEVRELLVRDLAFFQHREEQT